MSVVSATVYNVSLNKTTWNSSYNPIFPSAFAVDGNTTVGKSWISTASTSHYLGVDFGQSYYLDNLTILFLNGNVFQFYINGSQDNVTYSPIYSNASFRDIGTVVFNVKTSYRYVNLSFLYGAPTTSAVTELYAYSTSPTLLTPANQSIQAKTFPPLTSEINFTWVSGGDVQNNIVISKDVNFNLIVANTTISNNYSVHSLENATYWWKVRYVNISSGAAGNYSDVFNFTLAQTTATSGVGVDGVVYEIINGVNTPISGATVYLYNATLSMSQITGSNGYYLFQTSIVNSTTYNVYASKTGYDTSTVLPVTTGLGNITTNNILMKLFISPYVPNFVYEKFLVRGLYDNPFPGLNISIYKGTDLIASVTGTTDSAGQFVAQLLKEQQYRVTLNGTGLSSMITFNIFAKEETYTITVASGFPTTGNRGTDIISNLTYSIRNATYNNLSLNYSDSRASTIYFNFFVRNLSTNTTTCHQNLSANGLYNCSVPNTGAYAWGFNASSSVYGFFQQTKVINFGYGNTSNPHIPVPGVSSTLLHWMSIMLIVLTASLFSARTVKFGAVIVPMEGMVFWAFGWFNAPFLLVSVALILGILVYIRLSEAKTQI